MKCGKMGETSWQMLKCYQGKFYNACAKGRETGVGGESKRVREREREREVWWGVVEKVRETVRVGDGCHININ